MFSEEEKQRYSRHLLLKGFGLEGQEKLKNSKVLLVGAGGLGCPIGLYLAAAGVGSITVMDFDLVDNSNLQRQVAFENNDIGLPKAEVLCARMRELNPHIDVKAKCEALDESNAMKLFRDHDLIVDGSDNFTTRYLVNDASYLSKVPLVSAAVSRYSGQISVYNLEEESPCYRCLFPHDPANELTQNCNEAGVLGALVGVMGSLQAVECLKVLTCTGEVASGQLITYDMLTNSFNNFKLQKSPSCRLCGPNADITKIVPQSVTCTSQEAGLEIEVFEDLYRNGSFKLLDIREETEFELFPLKIPAIHIPLSELKDRLNELDESQVYCAVCQFGERARKAHLVLKKAGMKSHYLTSGMEHIG